MSVHMDENDDDRKLLKQIMIHELKCTTLLTSQGVEQIWNISGE